MGDDMTQKLKAENGIQEFSPGIDLDKLGQLTDELEAEAFAESLEKSRDSARRQRSRSRA